MKKQYILSSLIASAIGVTTFTTNAHEPMWKNLPPSKQHSPGHIEIPAKLQNPSRDINMVILIKSENFVQDHDSNVEFQNYYQYGEIFALPIENLKSATFQNVNVNKKPEEQYTMYPDYRSYFFAGNRYDSYEAMEKALPGEDYRFVIEHSDGRTTDKTVAFPKGQRPGPVKMSFYQDGKNIDFTDVDYAKDLMVRWGDFSNGKKDPKGIMDDYVTIQLDKCDVSGKRIYTSGVATLNATYLTFEAGEAVIPAETMEPGKWYQLSGKFANVTNTDLIDNAPVVSAWMSYVDLQTATKGAPAISTCK